MNDERLSTPISPRGLVCPRPINRSGHSRKPPGVTKYQNRQQEIDRPTPDQLIRSQPQAARRYEVSKLPTGIDRPTSDQLIRSQPIRTANRKLIVPRPIN